MRGWNLFSKKSGDKTERWNIRTMFGPNLSFAATEAYKLLRTNLMFSFADEGKGHVIGITSSTQGEGKSSTACNLAYTLAESGAKVLLMEGDLRRPSIYSKLGLARSPGLTNLLVSRALPEEVIQHCSVMENMDVITCGEMPPNPSELLGSSRMEQLIQMLTTSYEYIIVDLPPVTVVSDALAISKFLDGVVMVVRTEVSDQHMLAEAMRLLNMVNVRILGFVYRDQESGNKKYGYKYSKKYYKYYSEYAKKAGKR